MYKALVNFSKILLGLVFLQSAAFAQKRSDTAIVTQSFRIGNGNLLEYQKPKRFGFITNLPKDAVGIAKNSFNKKSLKAWGIIAATTGVLIASDDAIWKGTHHFADNIHLSREDAYKNIFTLKMGGKDVSILKYPTNINTAFYQLGQGFPSLLIGGGLFIHGKIKNNYRSLSTASQLAESFILMGVGTQILKRISGRETPGHATVPGGKWRPLPSFSEYQKNTPIYDAFPSGHLATLMSTVTIFTENYPEKKWIKPVGYTTIGLVGFAMINNDVHWAGDYPLALGLGYICAKTVAARNRKLVSGRKALIHSPQLMLVQNYNAVEPGISFKIGKR